ncbi:AAA family ATPase [Variovorax saccharolyticus]|uniref:AAA family ATPase n=1 Tax=Variovorax saccharolyticus TaxID=3053516 RepID=UPI002575CC98|nr:AAA family ATPase [Variovorax sp. J31P216]MDM0029794.1 AAA family ATPase [Variovorax sp. J31P216]
MATPTHSALDIRAVVSRLDADCKRLLTEAANLAYEREHEVLDIEHVMVTLCASDQPEFLALAPAAGLDLAALRAQLNGQLATFRASRGLPPNFADRLVTVLRDAWLAQSLDDSGAPVTIAILLGAMADNADLMARLGAEVPALTALGALMRRWRDRAASPRSGADSAPGPDLLASALAKFTTDLTAQAQRGQMDPVVGRDAEIQQMIEILLRRRQNNPILTGEAGVGKTAIVEGLAQRIAAGQVPPALRAVRLSSLDIGLLRAGAALRGEVESRLKALIAEIGASERPVILFIDEAHTIVAAQGDQSDIANMIKPELARGSLRTIASTTWAEYKRYFEKDAALSRRFQTVKVDEPSIECAQDILQGLVPSLQKHHGVYVTQGAIAAAVRLSSRYLSGRQLPDKAISVLDTACARAVAARTWQAGAAGPLNQRIQLAQTRLDGLIREQDWGAADRQAIPQARARLEALQAQRTDEAPSGGEGGRTAAATSDASDVRVGEQEVASVIADWTGVPSQKMLADQYSAVERLEETLHKRVRGQPEACETLCDHVRAFVAKLEDPTRPLGVLLLVGPSGIGKTETAHALAEAFFGPRSLTVVNMSEYQEAHSVSKLKGAPAGYLGYGQGGVLTEAIRRRSFGVLLLDEIEKAHPDVHNLFLQVFDKGFMEDSEGVHVDFKNTLVIMTSNAGDAVLSAARASVPGDRADVAPALQRALLEYFQPAFLGRAKVIPYYPLSATDLREIVGLKLDAVSGRFHSVYHGVVQFDASVVDLIVARCASEVIGARWIDQFVLENIVSRLSSHVLGCLARGEAVGDVLIDLEADRVRVRARPGTLPHAESRLAVCGKAPA